MEAGLPNKTMAQLSTTLTSREPKLWVYCDFTIGFLISSIPNKTTYFFPIPDTIKFFLSLVTSALNEWLPVYIFDIRLGGSFISDIL